MSMFVAISSSAPTTSPTTSAGRWAPRPHVYTTNVIIHGDGNENANYDILTPTTY